MSAGEQIAAVSNLFKQEPDGSIPAPEMAAPDAELGEVLETIEDEEVVPEQEPLGENLEASEDEAGSEATEGEGDEGAPGEIRTVAELAKAIDWDASDLYGLNMKLDTGEEIPLGEVKDKLQEYARQEADLAAQRQALTEGQQKLQEIAQQQFQGQQAMSQEMMEAQNEMQTIQAQYDGVNWEELAEKDPGRAALAQQQITAAYAGAKAKYGQAVQKYQQQAQQFVQHSLVENDQKFLEVVPEWKDAKVAETEGPQIGAYLQQWFQPQELERIYDWRARMLGRKAWLWDQHQANVVKATGKVQKAPKPVLSPGRGTVAAPSATAKRQIAEKVQRAKKSQRPNDQVSAIDAILSSSQRR